MAWLKYWANVEAVQVEKCWRSLNLKRWRNNDTYLNLKFYWEEVIGKKYEPRVESINFLNPMTSVQFDKWSACLKGSHSIFNVFISTILLLIFELENPASPFAGALFNI